MKITQEMIEAAALRWATMDGKKDLFLADKDEPDQDKSTGHYDGYMAEAHEVLKSAISVSPQPAIEYCITAGPGRLIDYGVCEGEMYHNVNAVTTNEGRFVAYSQLHIAPTTTACETGK